MDESDFGKAANLPIPQGSIGHPIVWTLPGAVA
jgi:hypothetical protein